MVQSTASVLSLSLLLSSLCVEIVRAEAWDPSIHYPHSEELRAPRTSRRVPRRLRARQANNTTQAPGQPQTVPDSVIGGFAVIGDSGVSAQQLFLGTDNQVCWRVDMCTRRRLTLGFIRSISSIK